MSDVEYKLCIAVVGASGHWGPNIARDLKKIGCEVLIVTEGFGRVSPGAMNFATSKGFEAVSWEGALSDPNYSRITAVAIASPIDTHVGYTAEALGAGKHVYCEKSVALNSDDINGLLAAAETRNVILAPGHQLLYHPGFLQVKELLKELGKIRSIYANRMLVKTNTHGDVIQDLLPHDLSLIIDLLGCDIQLEEGNFFSEHGIETCAEAHLRYTCGNMPCNIQVSRTSKNKHVKLIINSERGKIIWDQVAETVTLFEPDITKFQKGNMLQDIGLDRSVPPLQLALQEFVTMIQTEGRPDFLSRENLRRVTKALEQTMALNAQTPSAYFARQFPI